MLSKSTAAHAEPAMIDETEDAKVSMFKPSHVVLTQPCPFLDTFDHAEAEVAAAILIMGMVHRGDSWAPLKLSDCIAAVRDHGEQPGYEWLKNPFLKPSFHKLVSGGWVESVSEGAIGNQLFLFTPKGMEALSKWTKECHESA